jgi:hypothetical protein
MTIGNKYKLTFDLLVNTGAISLNYGVPASNLDSSGVYEFIFTATTQLLIFSSDDSICDILLDNVSLVEVVNNNLLTTSDTYGSCSECVLGCTDSLAFNYSDSAIVDDGS